VGEIIWLGGQKCYLLKCKDTLVSGCGGVRSIW